MEISKRQKIQALRQANPSLTVEQACLLLGFASNDPEIVFENLENEFISNQDFEEFVNSILRNTHD